MLDVKLLIMFQLPKDGQPDAGLTKDYANSGLHRFKKPGSKNYQNIYPPSATLHLSNIPSGVEEDDLRKAFQNINISVQVSPTLSLHTGTQFTQSPGNPVLQKSGAQSPGRARAFTPGSPGQPRPGLSPLTQREKLARCWCW